MEPAAAVNLDRRQPAAGRTPVNAIRRDPDGHRPVAASRRGAMPRRGRLSRHVRAVGHPRVDDRIGRRGLAPRAGDPTSGKSRRSTERGRVLRSAVAFWQRQHDGICKRLSMHGFTGTPGDSIPRCTPQRQGGPAGGWVKIAASLIPCRPLARVLRIRALPVPRMPLRAGSDHVAHDTPSPTGASRVDPAQAGSSVVEQPTRARPRSGCYREGRRGAAPGTTEGEERHPARLSQPVLVLSRPLTV